MQSRFAKLKAWIHFQNPNYEKHQLDVLLSNAGECRTYQDKAEWLIRVFSWLRSGNAGAFSSEIIDASRIPGVRLKYLMQLLERNPQWSETCCNLFLEFICNPSNVDLWADVGLSHHIGFFQELGERLLQKVLPETPLQADSSNLLNQLFPNDADELWVIALDDEALWKFVNLLASHVTPEQQAQLKQSVEDAILCLMAQVRSFGLSSVVRSRIAKASVRDLPFYKLASAEEESRQPGFLQQRKAHYFAILNDCDAKFNEVYAHLDEFGVSISLVFQIERTRRQIQRIRFLLAILSLSAENVRDLREFMAQFVMYSHSRTGIRRLVRDNFNLLAKKVVERNSEIGDHYIVRGAHEYWHMLEKAMGGGAVTAFTVYLKFLIAAGPFTPFFIGILASFNYALSFLAIQLLGFTLGTKQPASTAPALARKIRTLSSETLDDVCQEALAIMKSQFVSVLGNMLAVLPLAILFNEIYSALSGQNFLSPDKVKYVISSTDILSAAPLFGAFTGVLLFLSSLIAGWVDNWFVFRKVGERLAYHYRTRKIFGDEQALRFARFVQNNVAGFAANISLGLFLGFLPEVFRFIGIPLDVRHVTLSTGSLGVALPTLTYAEYFSAPVVRGILGIFLIGFLNVAVSFSLALLFATTANKIRPRLRRIFLYEFTRRFVKKPWRLILPNTK